MRGRRWFRGRDAAAEQLEALARAPHLAAAVVLCLAFAATLTGVAWWARGEPLVAVGRVMGETRIVRVPLAIEDRAATEVARETARQRTPRTYVADTSVLDDIEASLVNLPRTLANVSTVEEVAQEIREQFRLTGEMLSAVKGEVVEGEPSAAWRGRVAELMKLLRARPIVDEQTWQRATQEGRHSHIKLVEGTGVQLVPRGEIINRDDPGRALERAADGMARDAGFVIGPQRALVVSRLTTNPKVTFRSSESMTTQDQNAAAESVSPVIQEIPVGQIIFARGDVLTQGQLELFVAARAADMDRAPPWRRWMQLGGIFVLLAGGTAATAGYTALFMRRVRASGSRMLGLAALFLGTLGAACAGTVLNPALAAATLTAPTLFLTFILVIAYDQRSALAYGALHALLLGLMLDLRLGPVVCAIAGVTAAAWQLREVRDRGTLVRTSVVTALVLGVVTLVAGVLDKPLERAALVARQAVIDGGIAAAGALVVGGVTLFILPLIERAFGIVTAMTLVELRDPKQPLLREIQLRAPGTYNHSLNVASIAEAAASAIGADGLLTYVGALYHDCGKISKPEYFVENQSGGPNKHEKLSPAMSLLLVVGHVKDGLELAKEFGLPGGIRHFIESHHGTTLVEYFYHRARRQALKQNAEAEEGQLPQEFEYRYPGPRPATKEVAIVMIADAVESATRTLPEPTPSRIDALVRSIANKRLLDGQFDDCDLTLKELNQIVESISRTVASIYHGRVVYPGTAEPERAAERTA